MSLTFIIVPIPIRQQLYTKSTLKSCIGHCLLLLLNNSGDSSSFVIMQASQNAGLIDMEIRHQLILSSGDRFTAAVPAGLCISPVSTGQWAVIGQQHMCAVSALSLFLLPLLCKCSCSLSSLELLPFCTGEDYLTPWTLWNMAVIRKSWDYIDGIWEYKVLSIKKAIEE